MLRKIRRKIGARLRSVVAYALRDAMGNRASANRFVSSEIQCMLKNQYRLLKKLEKPDAMPSLNDVGFSAYSQFEEDGILLYIFSIVGTANKKVVEICAGDGIECMSANLILNHGWQALLMDGNAGLVDRGRQFYAKHPLTYLSPPVFKHTWITAENVNVLVTESGFSGQIDLLSFDVDGNDYWILKALNAVEPRVIICETHGIVPPDLALTMPYTPDFDLSKQPAGQREFHSASLLAMKKLCAEKGYRFIGTNALGFNAIFMRNDIGQDYFPEISAPSVHEASSLHEDRKKRWSTVKDLPWVKI